MLLNIKPTQPKEHVWLTEYRKDFDTSPLNEHSHQTKVNYIKTVFDHSLLSDIVNEASSYAQLLKESPEMKEILEPQID